MIIGGDSRPSTQHLKYIITLASKQVGACVSDLGLCSTPQLDYTVMMANKKLSKSYSLDCYHNNFKACY